MEKPAEMRESRRAADLAPGWKAELGQDECFLDAGAVGSATFRAYGMALSLLNGCGVVEMEMVGEVVIEEGIAEQDVSLKKKAGTERWVVLGTCV